YTCQHCGHELEIIQKITDLPLETCPACTENTLKKRISKAGFRLKGSGWYETDFKGQKKTEQAAENTSKAEKTETTSNSCPATTSATNTPGTHS
ncbi:MAG: FmdB family zinc ribbon protein, partial [Pseudomonadota bacterium]|nr:FmdB family zinc ribbon protein [Pseudomonadota bacterium]